jgi:RNA polymerase sigma factor (sigma-70 family)
MGAMTEAEQAEAIAKLKNGCSKARDSLILEHMDLAMRLAGSYWLNNQRRMDDIRGAAMLGLVEAVEWASANLRDDNIGAVINVTVRRYINDYILYDQTVRCPKSERDKPHIISATCHDGDGNSYEDFTLAYKLYATTTEQMVLLREFCERMDLSYRQRNILEMRIQGHTMAEIAGVFKCTPPRISQIIKEIGNRYEQLQSLDNRT